MKPGQWYMQNFLSFIEDTPFRKWSVRFEALFDKFSMSMQSFLWDLLRGEAGEFPPRSVRQRRKGNSKTPIFDIFWESHLYCGRALEKRHIYNFGISSAWRRRNRSKFRTCRVRVRVRVTLLWSPSFSSSTTGAFPISSRQHHGKWHGHNDLAHYIVFLVEPSHLTLEYSLLTVRDFQSDSKKSVVSWLSLQIQQGCSSSRLAFKLLLSQQEQSPRQHQTPWPLSFSNFKFLILVVDKLSRTSMSHENFWYYFPYLSFVSLSLSQSLLVAPLQLFLLPQSQRTLSSTSKNYHDPQSLISTRHHGALRL